MGKALVTGSVLVAGLGLCGAAQAALITTVLSTPLTTPANPNGGNTNGTGVWFDPLTAYSEVRGKTFPTPLLENGKFFLIMDTEYVQTEAEIDIEGLYSAGNGVIYQSSTDLNAARFGDGASIGPSTGYQSAGAGYSDLGPTFGNWAAGGHGYIGLTIGGGSSIEYGYAEIEINPDFSTTLLSFAVQTTPGVAITTVSTVPEPASLSIAGLVGAGLLRRRRTR